MLGKKPAQVCSIAVHGISFMGEDQSALSRYKKKIKSPRAGIKILIKYVLCQKKGKCIVEFLNQSGGVGGA
jgi:hypothetical protein